MPKRFFLIALCSFVFFNLYYFLCSFIMIYRPGAGDPLAWVGPSVVAFFVLAGLGLRRHVGIGGKILQAVASVIGLPILLGLFLGFGEKFMKPMVVTLGGDVHSALPDFFASFFSLVFASSLFGLIPAFFVGLATTMFYVPLELKERRAKKAA
ncbi:MAG: hypothetical protein EOP11_14480 [Proteobacteria bacterium]|nr:MAG: hypothetical protein EOP11_14480 [Pseudomonadota bacterium]